MTAVTLVVAGALAQPLAAQSGLPRGATIEGLVLRTTTGQSATGNARVAEPFNPAAGRGAATLALDVAPGPLLDLISQLHESRGTASGEFSTRHQQAGVMEVAGLKYEFDQVEVTGFQPRGAGARATLRVARIAAAEPTRGAAVRQGTPQRVAMPGGARELDASRVAAPTRQAFSTFWSARSRTAPADATALERKLEELERRSARGENVEREAQRVLADNPDFAALTQQLAEQPMHLASASGGGDPAAALICHGIGWIGKNGKLRCIGQLVII